jgi:hypothetical protein
MYSRPSGSVSSSTVSRSCSALLLSSSAELAAASVPRDAAAPAPVLAAALGGSADGSHSSLASTSGSSGLSDPLELPPLRYLVPLLVLPPLLWLLLLGTGLAVANRCNELHRLSGVLGDPVGLTLSVRLPRACSCA